MKYQKAVRVSDQKIFGIGYSAKNVKHVDKTERNEMMHETIALMYESERRRSRLQVDVYGK